MKYRNIIARCSWNEADEAEITLCGDHGSDDILAKCHPVVGVELSDASEISLKEYAKNYIDVNYQTLSEGLENPQERPLLSLSSEVFDFAERIQAAANYLADHGRQETMEGNWVTEFSELDEMFDLQLSKNPILVQAIGDSVISREEVADFDVDTSEGVIDIDYYAKIIAKTVILSGSDAGNFGQNAYFYEAAEGLLTSIILLLCEFCPPETRHIISVYKLIQELSGAAPKGAKTPFQQLLDILPEEHKAKWFAGAAASTSDQAAASVVSTAMSRLNTFLDSEMEQILCSDTKIDAEKFCLKKSAVFIILPEEDNSKYFMVSLIVQQMYREILAVADEHGGKLPKRAIFFLDEIGTIPKIDSLEMAFSAIRSRRVSIVAIIQSFAQLERNYGKAANIWSTNVYCLQS